MSERDHIHLATPEQIAETFHVPYWLISDAPRPSWRQRPLWRLRALIWLHRG